MEENKIQKKIATYYAKVSDLEDKEYKIEILDDGPVKKVAINEVVYEVDYNVGGDTIYSIIMNNHSHGVQISKNGHSSYEVKNKGDLFQVELMSEFDKIRATRNKEFAGGRQIVSAPMPGVILKVYVEQGQEVKRGEPLCVLVAMKMENEIRAVTDGIVKEIHVGENEKVVVGDKIMIID